MEAVINAHTTAKTGSIEDVFSAQVAIKSKWYPQGWKDLDMDAANANMKVQTPDVQNHGARLLLLLAYIMTTNVLDDRSNDTQM